MPVGIEDDDFERVINTNLIGSWRMAQHFVPLLQDTGNAGMQTYVHIHLSIRPFPSSHI
jgi:NAD(P)-dependent dehydrogenase (short-subunit alcohol dehydrogenase family)